jgi:ankyrin repeat protein
MDDFLDGSSKDRWAYGAMGQYPFDPRPRYNYAVAAAATEAQASRRPSTRAEERAGPDANTVFSAARHGKAREVEAALQQGFLAHTSDAFGNTLYHVACQNGNKRIAKLAIKNGGRLNAKNNKGNTGLHFLVAFGYTEIAEYFISKGADPSVQNFDGKRADEGL